MSSVESLVKIAGIGGIIIGVTGYAFRFKIQQNVYESEIYKDTLQYFYNHKTALELLGIPVKEGRVNISNSEAFGMRDNIGWLTVPLRGSKRNGELRAEVIMYPESIEPKKYNIYKIELKVKDMPNKVFVLKDNSVSTEDTT